MANFPSDRPASQARWLGQGWTGGRDRVWAIATASRCRALLAAERGEPAAAAAALEESFMAHASLGMPFELGRTHLVAAEVTRRQRQKRAVREHAQAARGIFAGLGAWQWARRAEADLELIGVSPTPDGGLTSAERKIAELVAAGRTNAEVAAELYMGLRTVEAHLSRVYRKLGLRSRTELAGWWAGRGDMRP